MKREVLDRWCEQGIFGLVLAILVYGPLATGAVRAQDFLVIQGLTTGVVVLWVLRLWLNPRPQFLWPPVCWAVIAFAAYAIARYLTTDIEYVARLEMIRVLVYAILFLAILNNLYRQEFTQVIVFTLVFLAMADAFYALYQFLTGSNRVWTFVTPYVHRGTGTYISPNNLAGFLEMVLPLGLAWVLVSRAKPLTKVFVGYASFMILAGIAVSISRGSWISVGLALLVFFAVLSRHRSYRVPAAVLLVVIIGAGIYAIPRTQLFQKRLQAVSADDWVRFEIWRPAVQMWEQNPWWGLGPGQFNDRFRAYRPETIQREPDWVHNDYLNTLTDWGIGGMTLVASALVLLAVGLSKTWRCVQGPPNDFAVRKSNKFALVLGASIGLLAMLIHSVVDFNMHIPANAIVAVTLMALLSATGRFATDKYWRPAQVPVRVAASLLLLAGALYLGRQGMRTGTEYVWLERARHAPNFSDARIAALKQAFAAEPMNFQTAYDLGEAYRVHSFEGGLNYADLAARAMDWFERSMKLNPYHGYAFMRYGMCLDWLDRPAEASRYFNRAVQLDPNGYFTAAFMGWHYVQTGDYAAARVWFERSLRLHATQNQIAESYLKIVRRRLLQAASSAVDAAPLAR